MTSESQQKFEFWARVSPFVFVVHPNFSRVKQTPTMVLTDEDLERIGNVIASKLEPITERLDSLALRISIMYAFEQVPPSVKLIL